uniref:Cilia- and flagella-associated protein 206 n=1 Tax=Steinernema glaseri TaxID=37863 RepID=A0A1I8A971_9BILA
MPLPDDETSKAQEVESTGAAKTEVANEPTNDDEETAPSSPPTGVKRKRSPSSCSQPSDDPSTSSNFPPSPRTISTHLMAQETIEMLNKMAVVHAVAFDQKVELSNNEDNPVQQMMEKAHFDSMREELEFDPPIYFTFLSDIWDMKNDLISLVPEGKPRLLQRVQECVDEEHLLTQADNKAVDFEATLKPIIDMAQMMCMPVRDPEIEAVRQKTDVTEKMRALVGLILRMKLDMANYNLTVHSKLIKENSMQCERDYYLKVVGSSPEFASCVKRWLKLSYDKVMAASSDINSPSKKKPTSDEPTKAPLTQQQRTQILTGAYVDLLEWSTSDSEFPFPETLAFDKHTILALVEKYHQLIYTTSALVVTQNIAGKDVLKKEDFLVTLKNKIIVLLNDVEKTNVNERMEHVAVLCENEVQLAKKEVIGDGYVLQAEADRALFKNQIIALGEPTNTVRCLLHKRLRDFFTELVNNPADVPHHLLSSFKFVESEVAAVTARFLRIVDYNRRAFGDFYIRILDEVHNES